MDSFKRMKPDVLMEMGLAMLEDEDEPLSAGDSQTMVSMRSPYNNTETKLLSRVNEDINTFNDPFGDNFMMFRRQKSNGRTGEDHFRTLSDEMVLSVFRWLPKKTLKQCALVCRRWRNIARDEELWTRLDLGFKTLCPGNLGDIIKSGVRILRLAQADIPEPAFEPNTFPDDYVSRLQFLDLSMAVISHQGLKALLKRTKHLIKLSLEHCVVSDEVCDAIAQNTQLEVLNMTMVYALSPNGLRTIITNCRRLVALNLGWSGLTVEALDVLMSCLPPNISQLNLSGCRQQFLDRHVFQLVRGCPKLMELDISDANDISPSTIDILCQFKNLEHLSISRCYHIFNPSCPQNVLKLGTIPSLRFLDLFGLEKYIPNLVLSLPSIEINKFEFSSIARPTVGIRRTSIWGLRVRD
ncbi:S-phase kinase-associated protein 2 isoform X2 [Thrips palmi]|uniref:S-phase kinase-associated protein 2 isoform X2 n=1 Tax=Thrips palmi TaxID=161013 RepID=A0A6P8Z3C6_THRPL|nr:S-phase kinase-associated protein 2 isoform X2 [Thrips palmi]